MKATLTNLIDWTGMGFRTIKKRLDEAGLQPLNAGTRSGKGRAGMDYDSTKALPILYAAAKGAPGAEGELDLTKERAKLAAEQARKYARENDLEEAKLAPIEVIKDTLEQVAAQMVPLLEALPLEMKRRNPNLTAHDIMMVQKCIAKCRNAIADISVD